MLYDFIAECDTLYPNTVSYSQKKKWLDKLEKKLREKFTVTFDFVIEDTVAPYPYDDIYVEYLKMKCAEASGDIVR